MADISPKVEVLGKLKYLIKKCGNITEISNILNVDEELVIELIELINDDNQLYDINNKQVFKHPEQDIVNMYSLDLIKDNYFILAISDTHIGCKQERLDLLKYLYEKALVNSVDLILHLGDVVDGISLHDDNNGFKSFDSMLCYTIKNYPYSIIPTYLISGNHDTYLQKNYNFVEELVKNRTDLHYLGSKPILLNIDELKLLLAHGNESDKDYDNLIEKYQPNLFLSGHTHKYSLQEYLNCQKVEIPSLIDIKHYNDKNIKGAWWIKIRKLTNDKYFYDLQMEDLTKKTLIKTKN